MLEDILHQIPAVFVAVATSQERLVSSNGIDPLFLLVFFVPMELKVEFFTFQVFLIFFGLQPSRNFKELAPFVVAFQI